MDGWMDGSLCPVQGWFGISWPTGGSNVKQFTDGKEMAGLYGMPMVKPFDE